MFSNSSKNFKRIERAMFAYMDRRYKGVRIEYGRSPLEEPGIYRNSSMVYVNVAKFIIGYVLIAELYDIGSLEMALHLPKRLKTVGDYMQDSCISPRLIRNELDSAIVEIRNWLNDPFISKDAYKRNAGSRNERRKI